MKTEKIQSELKKLTSNLKEIAKEMGPLEFGNETDVNPKDVSAWLNGHRAFSYEKLLRISLKIQERVLAHRKKSK